MLVSSKIKQLSDNELIDRYKSTEDLSLTAVLYQRYTSFVFAVCMKYLKDEELCKDAVMDIYEKLIVDLLRFDIENFKPWLHMVTKNHCLLFIRTKKYQRKYHDKFKKDTEIFMDYSDNLYHDDMDNKDLDLKMLADALNSLKDEQKECVKLFYLEEKCYAEVSEITGYTMKNVKSYIQNGKRNLKNYLTENKTLIKNAGTIILCLIFIIIL